MCGIDEVCRVSSIVSHQHSTRACATSVCVVVRLDGWLVEVAGRRKRPNNGRYWVSDVAVCVLSCSAVRAMTARSAMTTVVLDRRYGLCLRIVREYIIARVRFACVYV